jgi:hypothetical protein
MANEFIHIDPGAILTKAEFELITGHQFNSQATGDILYASTSTQLSRLGIGSNTNVLEITGGVPAWVASSGTGSVARVTSPTFVTPALGTPSALVGTNISGTAASLTVGSVTASANNCTNETVYPVFVDGATGGQGIETDTGLTYNPSSGLLTAAGFSGPLTGNVTGNASGTAATVTGGTQSGITTVANVVTVGALDSGSITSGFGTIDTGSSTITTTGLISGGSLDIDNVLINGTTIGHTCDSDLMTVTNACLTIKGAVTVGVNGTGHDVKFFGCESGAYMLYDESEEQLEIRGAAADATTSTGKLLLSTALTAINACDVIGSINFQAPLEAGSCDAILVAAGIRAVAQATFTCAVNATDLIFYTGHSEAAAERFRFTSQNEIGIAGANYGTDGQVLTSGGAGAAVAWECAGGSGLSAASQAEMESGSSNCVAVTPGRWHNHPGANKGWGRVTGAGRCLGSNYNVSGSADGGVGIATISWDTDFCGTGYNTVTGFPSCERDDNSATSAGTVAAGSIKIFGHACQARADLNVGFSAVGDHA